MYNISDYNKVFAIFILELLFLYNYAFTFYLAKRKAG